MAEHKAIHATENERDEADPTPLVLGAICMAPLALAAACWLFLI